MTIVNSLKILNKYIPQSGIKYPGKLGLDRMIRLVMLLGNPHKKYNTIHIGGTSGKGSTATFIANILATKYKVGLHTSPHLERVNERITLVNGQQLTINKKDITDEELVKLLNEVIPAVKKMEKESLGAPSYFEITTAIAFLYFAKVKVDFAVIEVGLGGTYDATNIINPLVSVITNVGLDHTEILGDTVEKIAQDKAGIIKKNTYVVSGVKQESVTEIIKRKALSVKLKDKRLSFFGKDFDYKNIKLHTTGSVFDYIGEKSFKNLRIRMLGEHQVENASLAVKVFELLNSKFSSDDIQRGLISAYIGGRLEIISKKPTVILDGAHNPDKMKALVDSLKALFPGKKYNLVLAIKEGKNSLEIFKILLPVCRQIYLTDYKIMADQGEIKSYSVELLKKEITNIDSTIPIRLLELKRKNISEIIKNSDNNDIILVTGSLYLIGIIKKIIKICLI
jgi:dihydrofolate synthase/folylpolyglutamate synthase